MSTAARLRILCAAALALVTFTACDESSPTAVAGSPGAGTKAAAPIVTALEAEPAAAGTVMLRARVTNPAGGDVAYAWRATSGQLADTTGERVQWRLPTAAGRYTVAVDVTGGAGKATASQVFAVTAAGVATAAGTLTAAASAAPTVTATPAPTLVGGVATGNRVVATPLPSQPPFLFTPRPVATPTPFAGFTPTPLPPTTAPTAQPGVPVPPTATWQRYPGNKIPGAPAFHGVHFPSPTRGYLVGALGTVLLYDKTGADQPVLRARNPVGFENYTLNRVHFVSADAGYVAGSRGLVLRTADGGQSWEEIRLPEALGPADITALVVHNAQIIDVGDYLGRVYRTVNANAPARADVSWTEMPTRNFDRPENVSRAIFDGDAGADPNVSYFVGDGVYKLDASAPDATKWRKLLELDTGAGEDGLGLSVGVAAPAELWVGTNAGKLLRGTEGGPWLRQERLAFRNREFNGNSPFLDAPSAISALSVIDRNTGFLGGDTRVYDTLDAAASWRAMPYLGFVDMQVQRTIRNGKGDFIGWAVTASGAFYVYEGPVN